MAKMAHSLQGVIPYQLIFNHISAYIIQELSQLLFIVSLGKVLKVVDSLLDMAAAFVLPERRESS